MLLPQVEARGTLPQIIGHDLLAEDDLWADQTG